MTGNNIEAGIARLVESLKNEDWVRAVGLSGGERPFPEAGQGDIDLFVYCHEIPGKSRREALLSTLGDCIGPIFAGRLEGGHWGQGDCCYVAGVETWLLYFTVAEACAELDELLNGKQLWRVDNYYYPIGRCAMWKRMRALYDPDEILSSFKTRLAQYPVGLAKAVIGHHQAALGDVEDLKRAVERKDVFFYHFAFDLALDHLLQILFALNETYFPSRKRSEQYLRAFEVKPEDCEERLRRAIALGGEANTLGESFAVWQDITQDLMRICSLPNN